MSMKIRILKDRLKTCTDIDMTNHINKIIKELEDEMYGELTSDTFVSRLKKLTEELRIYKS